MIGTVIGWALIAVAIACALVVLLALHCRTLYQQIDALQPRARATTTEVPMDELVKAMEAD